MPLTHTRAFRVRHYECDAHGDVQHANYLRYMQEAAFDASAAAGYDLDRYEAMGKFWLIRETDLAVHRPLHYGETVAVKTWVADFRRVRSRRAYELRLADSGALVARGHTDWVFLDRATERPASIPEAMKAAFFPEGPPDSAPPRERFPEAPPPPPGVFVTRRRVQWRDLDTAGHVNNAVYLAYFEDCAVEAATAHGWPPARMEAQGFIPVARYHRIGYRLPALLHDEIEIRSWLSDVGPGTAVRHFVLAQVSDGTLLARARSLWGTNDGHSGEPVPIPSALLSDLAPNVSREAEAGD